MSKWNSLDKTEIMINIYIYIYYKKYNLLEMSIIPSININSNVYKNLIYYKELVNKISWY